MMNDHSEMVSTSSDSTNQQQKNKRNVWKNKTASIHYVPSSGDARQVAVFGYLWKAEQEQLESTLFSDDNDMNGNESEKNDDLCNDWNYEGSTQTQPPTTAAAANPFDICGGNIGWVGVTNVLTAALMRRRGGVHRDPCPCAECLSYTSKNSKKPTHNAPIINSTAVGKIEVPSAAKRRMGNSDQQRQSIGGNNANDEQTTVIDKPAFSHAEVFRDLNPERRYLLSDGKGMPTLTNTVTTLAKEQALVEATICEAQQRRRQHQFLDLQQQRQKEENQPNSEGAGNKNNTTNNDKNPQPLRASTMALFFSSNHDEEQQRRRKNSNVFVSSAYTTRGGGILTGIMGMGLRTERRNHETPRIKSAGEKKTHHVQNITGANSFEGEEDEEEPIAPPSALPFVHPILQHNRPLGLLALTGNGGVGVSGPTPLHEHAVTCVANQISWYLQLANQQREILGIGASSIASSSSPSEVQVAQRLQFEGVSSAEEWVLKNDGDSSSSFRRGDGRLLLRQYSKLSDALHNAIKNTPVEPCYDELIGCLQHSLFRNCERGGNDDNDWDHSPDDQNQILMAKLQQYATQSRQRLFPKCDGNLMTSSDTTLDPQTNSALPPEGLDLLLNPFANAYRPSSVAFWNVDEHITPYLRMDDFFVESDLDDEKRKFRRNQFDALSSTSILGRHILLSTASTSLSSSPNVTSICIGNAFVSPFLLLSLALPTVSVSFRSTLKVLVLDGVSGWETWGRIAPTQQWQNHHGDDEKDSDRTIFAVKKTMRKFGSASASTEMTTSIRIVMDSFSNISKALLSWNDTVHDEKGEAEESENTGGSGSHHHHGAVERTAYRPVTVFTSTFCNISPWYTLAALLGRGSENGGGGGGSPAPIETLIISNIAAAFDSRTDDVFAFSTVFADAVASSATLTHLALERIGGANFEDSVVEGFWRTCFDVVKKSHNGIHGAPDSGGCTDTNNNDGCAAEFILGFNSLKHLSFAHNPKLNFATLAHRMAKIVTAASQKISIFDILSKTTTTTKSPPPPAAADSSSKSETKSIQVTSLTIRTIDSLCLDGIGCYLAKSNVSSTTSTVAPAADGIEIAHNFATLFGCRNNNDDYNDHYHQSKNRTIGLSLRRIAIQNAEMIKFLRTFKRISQAQFSHFAFSPRTSADGNNNSRGGKNGSNGNNNNAAANKDFISDLKVLSDSFAKYSASEIIQACHESVLPLPPRLHQHSSLLFLGKSHHHHLNVLDLSSTSLSLLNDPSSSSHSATTLQTAFPTTHPFFNVTLPELLPHLSRLYLVNCDLNDDACQRLCASFEKGLVASKIIMQQAQQQQRQQQASLPLVIGENRNLNSAAKASASSENAVDDDVKSKTSQQSAWVLQQQQKKLLKKEAKKGGVSSNGKTNSTTTATTDTAASSSPSGDNSNNSDDSRVGLPLTALRIDDNTMISPEGLRFIVRATRAQTCPILSELGIARIAPMTSSATSASNNNNGVGGSSIRDSAAAMTMWGANNKGTSSSATTPFSSTSAVASSASAAFSGYAFKVSHSADQDIHGPWASVLRSLAQQVNNTALEMIDLSGNTATCAVNMVFVEEFVRNFNNNRVKLWEKTVLESSNVTTSFEKRDDRLRNSRSTPSNSASSSAPPPASIPFHHHNHPQRPKTLNIVLRDIKREWLEWNYTHSSTSGQFALPFAQCIFD